MQTISAYILTYNEVDKLKAAAESMLWADEIVVIDSYSTDATAEIAAALGARVVQVPFKGFGDLRNRAIEACRCDRIFSLDADERCTAEVRDEILELLAAHDKRRMGARAHWVGLLGADSLEPPNNSTRCR
jgi:glycosyltransferase involved in cell wall biosynthesis